MEQTTSADGTPIAFECHGEGSPVVIVCGAMSTAAAGVPLAEELAAHGLQGVTFDRRARGSSGDTPPYAPEREVEDVWAVIRAVGGEAAVLGHSSGAVLALFAAGLGAPASHLFLSEPPFLFADADAESRVPERLQALVDAGENGEAIVAFQRDVVGLPEPVIDQITRGPAFDALLPLAQSVVYDALLTRAVPEPTPAMRAVAAPVTILRGEPTFPVLTDACARLHEAMPASELVVVPESHDHSLDPVGTVREILARIQRDPQDAVGY